jgi:hypothetical protein
MIMTGICTMGDVRMSVAVMMIVAMMIVVMIGMSVRRGACHHRRELRRGTASG